MTGIWRLVPDFSHFVAYPWITYTIRSRVDTHRAIVSGRVAGAARPLFCLLSKDNLQRIRNFFLHICGRILGEIEAGGVQLNRIV